MAERQIIEGPLTVWWRQQRQVATQSLQRLGAAPLSNLITLWVLAIAITLPTGFYLSLKNLELLGDSSADSVRISAYLQGKIDDEAGSQLAQELARWEGVANTAYISPEQALTSLKEIENLDIISESLTENPLPGTLVIHLLDSLDADRTEAIRQRAEQLEAIAEARFDLDWLNKLWALLALLRQLALLIAGLLALGVLLVVGNTIKLTIDNRRDEIVVCQLVGASHAFIRRPFIYLGSYFGAAAGALALLLIEAAMYALTTPISHMSAAYSIDIALYGPSWSERLCLLASSAGLGWIGAWLAASQHIRSLLPRDA